MLMNRLFNESFEMLEPYEWKRSRTVLRGGTGRNISLLPGLGIKKVQTQKELELNLTSNTPNFG
jgi:hypothetical protein